MHIENDTTSSMELYRNPMAITQNVRTQVNAR